MNNPLLRSISMDLTEHCNLACSYCFTQSDHKKRIMSLDMGKKILSWTLPQAHPDNVFEVNWWGGEPLLEYVLLQKLLAYGEEEAKKFNKKITFGGTTNGILYTPDKVEWLVNHQSAMLLSIDGIKPAHDCARKTKSGKGSWKIVDKNLRAALKIFPQQRIRASLSVDNASYFFESIRYFVEDLGIKNLAFSPVYEGDWNEKAFEVVEEQLELIVKYMVDQALAGTPFVIKHLNDGAQIDQCQQKQNPCGAGSGYVGFSYDGFIFPCHRFNKHGLTSEQRRVLPHVIGVPTETGFEWINQEFRNKMMDFMNCPPESCGSCEIFGFSTCNGNCYAVNFDHTGDIKKVPPYICRFQKLQQKYADKLKELSKEKNVQIQLSGWGGESSLQSTDKKGCVCYNGCYLEGTSDEITHIDGQNDISCLCYNANYNGPATPQYRVKEKIKEERHLLQDSMDMLIRTEPVAERIDLMRKMRKLL